MSDDKKKKPESKDYRIKGGLLANVWKIFAGVGAVGIAASLAGMSSDAQRFAFSYLFAFEFVLSIALGSLFFVFIQFLVAAGWSVTVRRTAEFFASALWIMAVLFAPIALNADKLYPWMNHSASAEHGTTHGAGHGAAGAGHSEEGQGLGHAQHGGHGHTAATTSHARVDWNAVSDEIDHEIHSELLAAKAKYLNTTFFYIRLVLYFLVWIYLSRRFFGLSTSQDRDGDPAHTRNAASMAPASGFLFAFSLTFAAFDWLMSLNPTWYSTIFGVWIFAGCVVAMLATLILAIMAMRANGVLDDHVVSTEHLHDLGKLMFGFNVFWAYIGFSQFFLIWYASIPEETVFYHQRWSDGPWKPVGLALLFLHFVVPFFFLLSRNVKRHLPLLTVGAALILVMHLVEYYWIVLPNYAHARHIAPSSPEALSLHWMDVTCVLGVGGAYLAAVFYQMVNHPVIPLRDPRLDRALHFQNA